MNTKPRAFRIASALAFTLACSVVMGQEPAPPVSEPTETPATETELAQDATQKDTLFPAWSLVSTGRIDPRIRSNAGLRQPLSYYPIKGGPLLYRNFSPVLPDYSGKEPSSPWSVRMSTMILGMDDEHVSAKFQEYRDVRNGMTAGLEGHYRSGDTFLHVLGRQIGRKDQDMALDGGVAGWTQWSLLYSETPHNFAFDAKSLWAGIGTDNLTLADGMQTDLQNTATNAELAVKLGRYIAGGAQTIDESLRRQSVGAEVALISTYPLTAKASFSNESRDGVRPWSASFGFGNFVEVPWVVKYDTHEFRASTEYAKPESRYLASASYRYSDFVNHIDSFTFDNPFRIVDAPGGLNCTFACGPSTGRMGLYPSNQYHELGGTFVVKNLPFKSTFNAYVSGGFLRQDEELLPFSTNSAAPPMRSPTNPSFNATDPAGLPRDTARTAMDTQTILLRWNAKPSKKLAWNAEYRLYRVDNDEEPFVMNQFIREDEDIRNPETVGGIYSTVLADYAKQTLSLQGHYSLSPDMKLGGAYTHEQMNRNFREVERMTDDKIKAEFDWRVFGRVELKSWIEHTRRTTSEYEFDQYNIVQGNPAAYPMVPWLIKYDESPYDRNEAQFMATTAVTDSIMVSAHAQMTATNYSVPELGPMSMVAANVTVQTSNQTAFGVRWDRRNSYGLDITWAPSEYFSVYGDLGFEAATFEMMDRQWTVNGISDPYRRQPVLESKSNWIARVRDNYYTGGLGIEASFIPDRLTLSFQYAFGKSDGQQVYSSPVGTAAVDDVNAFAPVPFRDVDDTLQHSLNPELSYHLNDHISLSAGYQWEEWDVNDYNYQGFTYSPLYTNGVAMLMGGLLPSAYSANIIYLRLKMGL